MERIIDRRKFILGLAAGSFTLPVLQARLALASDASSTLLPVTPLLPKRLETGMTVGVIAPSGNTFEQDTIRYGLDVIRSLGFEVKPSSNLFSSRGYLAGSDEQRADDINQMFFDSSVDAIFCLKGGYGSMRILPLIDYDLIRDNPKILLGYSDVTALFSAIYRLTGLVTFHGPLVFQGFTDYSYSEFEKVLMVGETNIEIGRPPKSVSLPGRIEKKNRIIKVRGGVSEGRLLGGNLSLVTALLGTPYQFPFEDCILFLEDIGEAPYRVDRMLTHLKLAGVLDSISGLIFGKFSDYKIGGPSLSLETVIRDHCESLNIPVSMGLMIGHEEDHNQTVVPIGVRARLDGDLGKLTLLDEFLVK